MASFKVDDLKSKLAGGGARANLFEVTLLAEGLDSTDMILCKAASLPASIIAPIMIPYRGRQLQMAGDRSFEPWTITIINDNDFKIRTAFEKWMSDINTHIDGTGNADPSSYFRDASVSQLKRDGTIAKKYDFKGLWPSNISAIELSYDTENAIEEFTVELQVAYWTAEGADS